MDLVALRGKQAYDAVVGGILLGVSTCVAPMHSRRISWADSLEEELAQSFGSQ